MFQSLRERLALLLIGILPFHALLVTVGTKMFAGAGHAPMTALSVWKEVLLVLIVGVALIEIGRLADWQIGRLAKKVDRIDALVVALILLAILVSAYNFQLSTFNFQLFYGFKYDFLPLIAFLILRRVPWSDYFLQRACTVIITAAGIIAVWGIVGMLLPQSVFTMLGYSDLHSLYQPDAPLAAFQQIGGSGLRRMQSTMSGPNQLGVWLLIPFAMLMTRKRGVGGRGLVAGGLVILAILLTFSRSAWIAALVIIGSTLRKSSRTVFICIFALCSLLFALLQPELLYRAASSRDHLLRPLEAIATIIEHPLGLGLGSAGPASNRVSDTCVYLDAGDDPSWATVHPNLCVFVGSNQVQPVDRACKCPFLPENWYLQIGVEMGVVGLVVYVGLVMLILMKVRSAKCPSVPDNVRAGEVRSASAIYLAFLGISIAALFLHAWEDSAVAYTMWTLMAAHLSLFRRPQAAQEGR